MAAKMMWTKYIGTDDDWNRAISQIDIFAATNALARKHCLSYAFFWIY